jgi:hypothetical protein
MPEAITTPTSGRAARPALNRDAKRHPILNTAAAFTLVAGVLAFPLGLIVRQHLAATIVGMAAFGIGMLAQLLSATRAQRIFIMAGVVSAFVGMGLGIAHGGFG